MPVILLSLIHIYAANLTYEMLEFEIIDGQITSCLLYTSRIEISNPYEGERRKIEQHYLTTKKQNTEMHGLGLMSVQKIVEKYDGLMEISDKDNVFRVVVTL